MCQYDDGRGWLCPFPPGLDKNLCIFHLPVEEKQPGVFWLHLASYLKALLDNAGTEATRKWARENSDHWIYKSAEEKLVNRYAQLIKQDEPWRFTGFVFPAMIIYHPFYHFPFPAIHFDKAQFSSVADFRGAEFRDMADFFLAEFRDVADFSIAQFSSVADFKEAKFSSKADFSLAQFCGEASFGETQFRDRVDFSGAQFSGEANFYSAQFSGRANFYEARFHDKVGFSGAQFSGEAGFFRQARFSGEAYFCEAQFSGVADFGRAQFSEEAVFSRAEFSGEADFRGAEFSGEADFGGAQFTDKAVFIGAEFSGEADFREAQFSGEAYFREARFDAPVYFTQTEVTGLLNFYRAKLRNRMSFTGTVIEKDAKVLLWDIDFVYGISEISFDKGYQKGKIVEPAGQIEFRDILKGMSRISFLHTDIFTNRLWVRFFNVNWEKKPEEFIFDAKFAFISEWNLKTLSDVTGLSKDVIKQIPVFFFTREQFRKGPDQESEDLKRCESLVKQDVERIAREIRRSTEEYGSYSDAGDFYIAEMDYRRSKTEKKNLRSKLFWLALLLYKLVSNYGESPSRALLWILGLGFVPAIVILVIGLVTGINQCCSFRQFLHLCGNTLANTLANMITLQFPSEGLLRSWNCSFFWIGHKIVGISVISLFLLAVRRRFRR